MIMTRIQKPADRKDEKWLPCSFFGLYDGHGGKTCSNFLRDNLHSFIIQDNNFPSNPEQAILNGFQKAENQFIDFAFKKGDKSGSCAVVVLIIGKKCFVANLGDSRAVLSLNEGKDCAAVSKDHKPNDDEENSRIVRAGGEVYTVGENSIARILPGRLAISRAFGDVDAKIKELGGNPAVLIAVPEIKSFIVKENVDFICLGSDGIFDRLSNQDVVELVWDKCSSFHEHDPLVRVCRGVERVINEAMSRMSYDNVTLLCVAFDGFVNGLR
jgi:protein phosphatase 2C family protein 2/3